MLIIALVLAVVGLAALVAAVVTSNELIAWVCIGASVIGVLLLIADALRSRRDDADTESDTSEDTTVFETAAGEDQGVQDYPDDLPAADSETEVVEVVEVVEVDAPAEAEAEDASEDTVASEDDVLVEEHVVEDDAEARPKD